MADLEELKNRKNLLDKALTDPTKSVQHGDKSVTNRSFSELKMMQNDVNRKIGRAAKKPITRQLRVTTSRGL
ncbi:MAG: hypothetical protein ABJN40_13225 [Sneathiella sp.]